MGTAILHSEIPAMKVVIYMASSNFSSPICPRANILSADVKHNITIMSLYFGKHDKMNPSDQQPINAPRTKHIPVIFTTVLLNPRVFKIRPMIVPIAFCVP